MNRFRRGRRILDAQIVLQVPSRHEILRLAGGAAIFEVGRNGLVTAAIEADATAVVEGIRLGLDVDDTRRAQAVLGGQRAGDQRKVAYNAGVEDLAEGRDTVGELNAVDAILNIAVLVAHMQIAAGRRILRHAGSLQQHLVQTGIDALWQRFDRLMAQLECSGADRGKDRISRRVQFFILGGHDLRLGRSRRLICHHLLRRLARPRTLNRRSHARLRQDVAGRGFQRWRCLLRLFRS